MKEIKHGKICPDDGENMMNNKAFFNASGKRCDYVKNGGGGTTASSKHKRNASIPNNKADKKPERIKQSKIDDLIDSCKKDWEIARRKKISRKERDGANMKIYDRLKGYFTKASKKRTGSKIIQTLFKYGNPKLKDSIFDEIYDDVPELCVCQFSVFVLEKLLTTKYLNRILKIVCSNHTKILTNRIGAFFFDKLYQAAKPSDQENIVKAFLGNEIKLFYNNSQLCDIPNDKFNFEALIEKIINKGLTNLEIAHVIIYYHILHFNNDEDARVFCNTLVPFFVDFLHTNKGQDISVRILNSCEDKKVIIEKISMFINNIIENPFTHSIVVDAIGHVDRKCAKEYIFRPIKENISTFIKIDGFDNFCLKLIETNNFDYLKRRFLRKVKKYGDEYLSKYDEVLKRLNTSVDDAGDNTE